MNLFGFNCQTCFKGCASFLLFKVLDEKHSFTAKFVIGFIAAVVCFLKHIVTTTVTTTSTARLQDPFLLLQKILHPLLKHLLVVTKYKLTTFGVEIITLNLLQILLRLHQHHLIRPLRSLHRY